ncbi:hypothetical protein F0P96_13970 [Hymenobacter busanensis]|uniref:Uncharacterized protein n=1 Tax=Hymenobacter busanensis TaxID=2607656 RepID=A0A7L4ZZZ4_9BACT|nr:hypothetical protein [Hymenobacter busanensis]KAA9331350.1 hypothetical protein F0P96_13970 [Hymenobacter busanensis]QHJ08503.1 hypothetical protein GUY19_14895 [Hymenobacter busanensis]
MSSSTLAASPDLSTAPSAWRTWRPRLWQAGACLAFWAEVRLFTDLRNYYGPEVSPAVFCLTSILLGLFVLLYWLEDDTALPTTPSARRYDVLLLAVVLGGVVLALKQGPIIDSIAIDLKSSDVIPILQTYVSRFRTGEVVYKYIYFSYPLFPNHLPMQWLPYVLADRAGVDYRWWGLMTLIVVGFGAYQWTLIRWVANWGELLLKAALPAFLFWWIIDHDPHLYGETIETTIIAYYCLLAAAVLSRSPVLQAVALVCCLLSRYSVVLWVPLYMLILWFAAGKRHAVTVALLTLVGIVGIYVWPFLSKDWTIFGHALREYKIATVGEWQRENHLFNGVGFAGWFLKNTSGTILEKINLMQKVHLGLSGVVVALCGALCWRLRRRVDHRVLALITLKWYLVVFYAFLQIPYTYLTSLVVFMSPFVLLVLPFVRRAVRPVAVAAPV